jgi:hypothetical protein
LNVIFGITFSTYEFCQQIFLMASRILAACIKGST